MLRTRSRALPRAALLALVATATGVYVTGVGRPSPLDPEAPGAIEATEAIGAIGATEAGEAEGVSTPQHGDSPRSRFPGPGPALPDRFHPDHPSRGDPRDGGQLVVHLETAVNSFNSLIDNSGVTRRLQLDLHERLVQRDWESWEFEGRLARRVVVEDTVVLTSGERLFGVTARPGEEGPGGEGEAVLELSPPAECDWPHPLTEPRRIPLDQVAEVLPETVFTFLLREDVRWHDGHPFDADDVLFTLRCTKNPDVPCEQMRFSYDKLEPAERLGPHALRVRFTRPYFLALAVFEGLTIQPAHLLDLTDPDHAERRDQVSDREQGRYLSEHPINRKWVGLGPYRVTAATDNYVDAERFEDYFEPALGGHFERVRWRVIRDSHAAFLALLNKELDFTASVSAADYFSERASSPAFRADFYTGLFLTPVMSYTVWNTARPPFDDVRVRRALSMGFDWEAFIAGYYRGQATRVTSEVYPGSRYYNWDVAPVACEPAEARALLAEAGWYDRDGDGLADKQGEALRVELLVPAGSATGLAYGQKLAEDLGAIGVEVRLIHRDAAVFFEQLGERDFDAVHLAWFMPVESDPEQIWHSRWVGPHTGNHGGLADAEVDRLIDALQVEPDDAVRVELFAELHRRVHDQQVYSYGVHVPRRFAASKRLRNLQTFALEPGYSLRRWYFAPEPESGD